MTGDMSIGKRLIRGFQLLFDYRPSEECEALINERMLSLPDKRTFQGVMMYILQFLDEDWCSKDRAVIITKSDERAFYNALCNHIKLLRRQFPEVGIPHLTLSSMYSFHGDRARRILVKICEALMLLIMKTESSDIEDISTEDSKIISLEIETLKEDYNSLQKQIQQIKEENEEAVFRDKSILESIISLGNWDKNTKTRLLDLKDQLTISELQKETSSRFEELVLLRKELQPFIDRTYEGLALRNQSSIEKLIYDLQDNAQRNFIRTQIANLNLFSEMQRLSVPGMQNIHENPVIDARNISQIIENLEILVQENTTRDQSYAFLEDSNCSTSSQSSPKFNTSLLYFTPKFDRNTMMMKMKNSPIEMDVQSLAKLACPITIRVDVHDLSTGKIRNTVIPVKTKLQTDTILSVAQKLASIATPRNLHSHIYKPFFDRSSRAMCTSSGSALSRIDEGKSCMVTPNTMQLPGKSRTTGQEQSMGLVKATGYFAPRHSNTTTPCLKHDVQSSRINIIPQSEKVASDQPSGSSSKENPKAVSDERLDRIVAEMVAAANAEKSFGEESDFLNSTLDGLDFLPSPSLITPAPKQMLSDSSLQDTNCSILSEISDIETDISGAVCELKQIVNTAEISNEDGNLLSCKEVSLQKAKCEKKTLSESMNELLERFNAIKKRSQK